MHFRAKIMLFISIVVLIASVTFSAILYRTQKTTLLKNIDEKLLETCYFARLLLSEEYHNSIKDSASVSEEEFTDIVRRNNELCLLLDLQYIWSCMLIDGDVVFTSSTSPEKDITEQEHAKFFEVHRDPQAFEKVFRTMRIDYSSFQNEWGRGRMVLVPFFDSHGRKYCFGASVSTDDIYKLLKNTLIYSLLISLIFIIAGILAAGLISRSLSRPVTQLTQTASSISKGNLDKKVSICKNAPREIQDLSHALDRMRINIRDKIAWEKHLLQTQKLESLGIMASGIAHDFNNLITAILTNLNLAKSDIPADHTAKESIDRAVYAAKHSIELTNQLLAYTGKGIFIKRNINLTELINENIQILKAGTSKKAHLHLNLDPHLPIIKTDPGQIQQIVMNLITNASDAMQEREGSIKIETAAKDCNAEYLKQTRLESTPPPGRFVYIQVTDTGSGIEEKNLQQLFDPFFTTKATGRGLGLSAIKGIVTGLKGAIIINTEINRGTTVQILFPVDSEDKNK